MAVASTQTGKLKQHLDANGVVDPAERLRWYEAQQDTGYHNQPATNHKLLNVRQCLPCLKPQRDALYLCQLQAVLVSFFRH